MRVRGPPSNLQRGGGVQFFQIKHFGNTLNEIYNLFQELFYINMGIFK